MPESLKKEHRRAFDLKRANPLGSFIHLKKYPTLIGLVLAIFLLYTGSHAIQSNWAYFTMYRFDWDEKMVGISLGVIGLLVALVQGLLIRWVNPKLGNRKSIYVGMALYAIGMFLFAVATEGWMLFIFLIVYCLGGIAGPALQAIITLQVPDNEQGEIQGTLTSLMSASAIVGPPLMTGIFYYFTKEEAPFTMAGAPFVLGGFLMLLSAYLAFYSLRGKRSNTKI